MNSPLPSEDPAGRRAVPAPDTELWHRDPLTSRAYLTPEWKALLGYEEHELGSDFNEFQSRLHPEEREDILRALHANAARPDFQLTTGFRLRHRDGTYRWMPAPGSTRADPPKPRKPARDPGALRLAAEARLKERPASRPAKPETDLRRLQHELEVHQIELEMQNEELRGARDQSAEDLERLTDLYEFAPIGYISLSADGTILRLNLLGATLLGLERGSLMGRRFGLFLAEADRGVFSDLLDRVLASEVKQSCEVRLSCEGAALRVLQVEGLRSPDRQECRAALLDITGRKEAEEGMCVSEARLRLSVAASDIGLWDWNLVTNEVFFSKEWKGQLGYAENEISNHFSEWESRVHPDELAPTLAKVRHAIANPDAHFAVEFRLRHKDGSYRWIYAQARILRDATQKPVRMLGCHIDTTERKRAEEARADTARFNEALLESSPLAILTYQASGQSVSANVASERIVGATRAQLLAQNFRELASWQRTGMVAAAEQVLASGVPQELEMHTTSSFGNELWLHCRLARFQHEGEPHLLACLTNIRERRLAEQELRLRAAALGAAANEVMITDRQGVIQWVNPAFVKTTGYTLEEAVGQTPRILNSGQHGCAFYQQLWATILRGAVWSSEMVNRRKDGSLFLTEITITPVKNERGEITHFVSIKQDRTERRKAEASLRLLRSALEAAANEVVITDRKGIIEWVNPAFTKTTGYTLEEAVGQNPRILQSGKHDREFYHQLWATLLRGEVWRGEMVNRRKDASLFTEEAIITAVKDEHGAITHFVAIKQDITEKKLLEAKFLRAQRLEGLGALAGGVAHDLNNVLAPVLMASELLKSQATNPQTRKLLEMIQTNSERGAGMIRQILAFARGSAGEKTAMQVGHLLKEISKLMQQTFPPNIRCELRAASGLELVLGESTELYQVLLNLCVNARDAMPKGGTITLDAENIVLDETYARLSHEAPPGHYVVITVADTGGGIPKEIQGKVFEPFFTTKELGKGTGLGLATVKDIVAGHKGFIHLYSEVGVGTQFKIYLPVAQGEEAAAKTAFLTLPGGHGELVLLVDDEAAVREIVKATLENYGYRVVTANDGTEGVARFFEHSKEVQLLLTDIQMPLMDGMALIRALRNVQPDLKVIAASGLSTHEAALKATGISVQAFIVKPFTAASLLLALDAALHPK